MRECCNECVFYMSEMSGYCRLSRYLVYVLSSNRRRYPLSSCVTFLQYITTMALRRPSHIILTIFFHLHSATCINESRDFALFLNGTNSGEYVGYVEDPNGRGTASLVISCLLTLVLCVRSALHLNVPQKTDTTLQHFLVSLR